MVPQLLRAHRVFKRCALWNLVLLVDEADVFLETRSKHNLDRNELVSSTFKRIIMLSPFNILFSISSTTGILYKSIDSDYKSYFSYRCCLRIPHWHMPHLPTSLIKRCSLRVWQLLLRDLALLLALILVCHAQFGYTGQHVRMLLAMYLHSRLRRFLFERLGFDFSTLHIIHDTRFAIVVSVEGCSTPSTLALPPRRSYWCRTSLKCCWVLTQERWLDYAWD